MNISELDMIKQVLAQYEYLRKGDCAALIAEVERLEEAQKLIAVRCAEIVEYEIPACSHPQTYAKAILEEYGIAYLPKVG